jgi:hypothetical protein
MIPKAKARRAPYAAVKTRAYLHTQWCAPSEAHPMHRVIIIKLRIAIATRWLYRER